MLKYTIVSNVSCVGGPGGVAHWAYYLLIDRESSSDRDAKVRGSFFDVRQIRGFTYGGIPTFTYWVKPDAEVTIDDNEVRTTTRHGEPLVLTLSREDFSRPIEVRDVNVESCQIGEESDREILKYYIAPGYPYVNWRVLADDLRAMLGMERQRTDAGWR